MLKFLGLLASIIISFQQDCNNPLIGPNNPNGPTGEAAPLVVTSLAYCTNILNGTSCCTDNIVKDYLDQISTTITDLQSFLKDRDTYLTSLRYNNISVWNKITALKNDVTTLNTTWPAIYPAFIQRFSSYYIALLSGLLEVNNFNYNMRMYATSRKRCFKTVLSYYANLKCSACDPNYASKGISGTSSIPVINFSPRICLNLASDCYDYFYYSAKVSKLIDLVQTEPLIDFISQKVNKATASGYSTDLLGDDIPQITVGYVDQAYMAPVKFPSNCFSNSKCDWACQNLYSKGLLNTNLLLLGGQNSTNITVFGSSSRLLASYNVYNPNIDDSGYTAVDIELDPAGVLHGGKILVNAFILISLCCIFLILI